MSEATPNDESRTSIEATWGNREFIERWIAKGGWQGPIREMQTAMVLRMIPQPLDAPIRVLDLGAGYGALAVAVLRDRPKATALCLDASAEMLKLGRERNALGHRIEFVQASLETPDWLNSVNGLFDAVISSRALHHFTTNQRRRFMFKEIFGIDIAGREMSGSTGRCGNRAEEKQLWQSFARRRRAPTTDLTTTAIWTRISR